VLDSIRTLPSGLPESSVTHIRSPTLNVLFSTLFELTELDVPLEKPGFSPKNTFAVLLHDERIVTETVCGPLGAGADAGVLAAIGDELAGGSSVALGWVD
jgi:hypothetical protein